MIVSALVGSNAPEWALVIVGAVTLLLIYYQARETARAARATEKSAQAALASAAAARRSADAIINSERAWVMVYVEWTPGYKGRFLGSSSTRQQGVKEQTTVTLRFVCRNEGKTPGWIREKRATVRIMSSLPEEPDLASTEILQAEPEPIGVGIQTHLDYSFTCDGQQAEGQLMVVYGIVRYRDAFGGDRHTTFGYRINLGNNLERLTGHSEYNDNT